MVHKKIEKILLDDPLLFDRWSVLSRTNVDIIQYDSISTSRKLDHKQVKFGLFYSNIPAYCISSNCFIAFQYDYY